jgi:protein SCO1/2
MKPIALVSALLLVLSCGPAPREERGPRVFEGVGTLVRIEGDQVTLEHGDIPGFMPAMTMSFPVKDPAIFSGLEEGVRVKFRIEVEGSSYAVVSLEKTSSP